jgi:hypothetical protein
MSTPKQFLRSVDFLSTEESTNTSNGSVNIFGGMSVSKTSYLTNTVITGDSTFANIYITGNLTSSSGSTLISSQFTSINSGSAIYFGTSANTFVGIGTTTPTFQLDISGGSRITGGLTVGSLTVVSGSTIPNILASTISTGTLNTINTSSANNTMTNILSTNITTTSLISTVIVNSGLISTTNHISSNISSINLVGTNITIGNINANNTININTTTVNSSSIGTLYISTRMNSVGNMLNSGTAGTLSTIIDLKVMNKRLKCSRQAAENSVSTMNRRTLATPALWGDICWSSELGLFAAMSFNGEINTSPDGIKWTARTSGITEANSIIWVAELRLFVIINNNALANIVTSPDGITWTIQTTPAIIGAFYGLCWSPELNLLVATTLSSTVLTSSNGINWTASTISGGHKIINVVWSPELLLFVGTEYDQASFGFAYSTDGINWTGVAQHVNNVWWGITWSPELFMFVAVLQANNTAPVAISPDGKNWTRITCTAQLTTKIVWNAELSMFMTTGQSGNAFTSYDGITWVNRYSIGINIYGCWSPELSIFAIVQYNSNICITSLPAIPASKSTVLLSPSQFNVNHSTGNVGINTTSPIYTLDVNGSIDAGTFLTSGNVYSTNITSSNIVATNISSSNIVSTNIGISTIPSFPLDVNGSGIAARFSGSGGDSSVVRFENTSSGGRIYDVGSTGIDSAAGNGFSIVDITNFTVPFIIGSSGNVGIGASDPAYKLDVNVNNSPVRLANSSMTAGVNDMIYIGRGTTTNNMSILNYNYISAGSGLNSIGLGHFGGKNKLVVNGNGSVGINNTNPTFTLDVNGSINAGTFLTSGNVYSINITSSNIVGINISSTNLISTSISASSLSVNGSARFISGITTSSLLSTDLSTTNITSTNIVASGPFIAKFNSNTLGNLYTTGGNISINTTSPNTNSILTLHNGNLITNTGGTQIAFNLGTNAGGYAHYINTRHQSVVGDNRNAIDFLINNSTLATGSIGLAGGSGNVNSMSLTATGVGIFDSSPAYRLDVKNTIAGDTARINNTNTGGFSSIRYQNDNQTWIQGLGGSSTSIYSNKWYVVGPSGTGNSIFGTTGGNWGINQPSPVYTLDVNGSIDAGTFLTSGNVYSTNVTSTNIVSTNISSSTLNLSTINASTISSASIQVSGNISTAAGFENIKNNTNSANTYYQNNFGNLYVGVDGNGLTNERPQATLYTSSVPISFYTGAAHRMIIGSTGNIGIGTVSPQSALHVVGNRANTPTTKGIHMGEGGVNDYAIEICAGTATSLSYIDFTSPGVDFRGRIAYNLSSNTIQFYTNTVPYMILGSGGNLGLGNAAQTPTASLCINTNGTNNNGVLQVLCTSLGKNIDGAAFQAIIDSNTIINFVNTAGTNRGNISGNGSAAVVYNTTSDSRLKENVIGIDNAISVVNSLRPVTFDWITETETNLKADFGFIAQEVFAIPEFKRYRKDLRSYTDCECANDGNSETMTCDCVDHENPVDKDGNPIYYSLDYGRFTPYLTKAIQELYIENQTLKQDILDIKAILKLMQ